MVRGNSACQKCGANHENMSKVADYGYWTCGSAMPRDSTTVIQSETCLRRQLSQREEELREANERVQRLAKDHLEIDTKYTAIRRKLEEVKGRVAADAAKVDGAGADPVMLRDFDRGYALACAHVNRIIAAEPEKGES